jgi:hypothetical protein
MKKILFLLLFNILPLLAQDCTAPMILPYKKDTLSLCQQGRYPLLLLKRDGQEISLWDSTISKKVIRINWTDIAIDNNNCSFMGVVRYEAVNCFVYLKRNQQNNKWELAGFYEFDRIGRDSWAYSWNVYANGTIFICKHADKPPYVSPPSMYRFNEWGDMEIYNLQNVQLRDLNIPHPGLWIPSTITDSLRRKNFPPYYEHVEILPPPIK